MISLIDDVQKQVLLEDLKRQVAEEMKGLEPNKQTETMLYQKYGLLRPLFTQEEMELVNA